MDSSDLELGDFFTTDDKDVWKLDGYYMQPSCNMKNLETGEIRTFGMGGTTACNFHRIDMPLNQKTAKERKENG